MLSIQVKQVCDPTSPIFGLSLSSFSPALAIVCLLSVVGFVLFETECYCVALADLEPTMYIRLFAICLVSVLVFVI